MRADSKLAARVCAMRGGTASYRGGEPLVPELWLLLLNVAYGLFVYLDFAMVRTHARTQTQTHRHAHVRRSMRTMLESDAHTAPGLASLCMAAGRDVGDHAPAGHQMLQAGEAPDAVARRVRAVLGAR